MREIPEAKLSLPDVQWTSIDILSCLFPLLRYSCHHFCDNFLAVLLVTIFLNNSFLRV